jgi:autotransporter-associated beta strand protein
MRGNGHTVVNGQINWGTNVLNTTADGTVDVTINSIGNTWRLLTMGTSTLHLGANNALPVSSPLELAAAGALLDMNGFNQQVGGLYGSAGGVRNNSTNTDSTLIVSSALGTNWMLAGAITHLPGAKSLSLDVAGDTLTLSAAGNNYTGSTTIRSGATLALLTSGNITSSSVINVQSGGIFDVSGRTSGDYTLPASSTLKGNGIVNGSIVNSAGTVSPGASIGLLTITNNLTISGTATAWMEVNNATATKDRINVGGTITYGGTLVVTNVSATPYTNNQVIKLFDSAISSYVGTFAGIVFPGVSAYDASNLTVDGSIKVVSALPTTPTNITFAVVGGNTLQVSWPSGYTGWRLEGQTNSLNVGISATWFTVPGSTTTNQMYLPINPANPTAFYRLANP